MDSPIKERTTVEEVEHEKPSVHLKTNRNGIVLVPQPTEDANDPLNWSRSKKLMTLGVISLGAFAGTVSAQANAAGLAPQAVLYSKSLHEMAYSLTASGLGLSVGPLATAPLARIYGKCALIFWSMIITSVCNVWSALMTSPDHFSPFVASRFFAALASATPSTVGSIIIVEVFYLHDRGKAFAIYVAFTLLGVCAGGVLSGYICEYSTWPVQFWYNVAFSGCVAVLCFFFLDESRYPRHQDDDFPPMPTNLTSRKLAIYFFTQRTLPRKSFAEKRQIFALPFKTAMSPTAFFIGLSLMMSFSWAVGAAATLAVFLQSPVAAGGYGFSPDQNSAFLFTTWVAVIVGQLWTHLVNDRVPLWICKRRGGQWHPEYRLYPAVIPMLVIAPIGVGLYGACLHGHWHYMITAFAVFLLTFADVVVLSPLQTYVVESIGTDAATEVVSVLYFERLVLGTLVPLFIEQWLHAVGVQWAFGMMAIFTVLASGIVIFFIAFGRKVHKFDKIDSKNDDDLDLVVRSDS